MKAYKGFNRDMTCLGFQYEEGKSYETDDAIVCESGFHACENPLDCFCYYKPGESVYHEVELDGEIVRDGEGTKVAATKITIGDKLSTAELIKRAINFVFDKIKLSGKVAHAVTSGEYANAATSGDDDHAATSGSFGHAATSGCNAHAMTSGNFAQAATSGYWAHAVTSGDYAHAVTAGKYAHAATLGGRSNATTSGDRSNATTSGYRSNAEVKGAESVAAVFGADCKARGALGCWLVLTERNSITGHISVIKAVRVDGKKYKPDTWYELRGGKIVKVED